MYICPLPLEPLSHLPPIPTPLVVTRPQFEFPESYSKFPFAVYFIYGSVYASVLLSIHLTLSFLPTGLFISQFSRQTSFSSYRLLKKKESPDACPKLDTLEPNASLRGFSWERLWARSSEGLLIEPCAVGGDSLCWRHTEYNLTWKM